MPKQGLQMTAGLITKWLKAVGDPVREGEPPKILASSIVPMTKNGTKAVLPSASEKGEHTEPAYIERDEAPQAQKHTICLFAEHR